MNKEVIYIDVDDDVTAIIGKIKASSEKIVALVPPKRAGALQSAVNLRLLQRMATTSKKKLVLITSNAALVGLAANAQIPVAKNLQSKPELAAVPAAVGASDAEEVIDGNEIPVGEHAGKIPVKDGTREQLRNDAVDTIDVEKDGGLPPAKPKARKKNKIPNFDTFRKKLIFGAIGGVLLIALLVWMFVFAPAATVIVTANTTDAPVSTSVTLTTSGDTDYEQGILKVTEQTLKEDDTIEFEATGTGKVGDEATGTMTVTRTSVSSNSLSVPAGTSFTSGGLTFVSTEGTTLSGTTIGPSGIIQDSATVAVQASEVGDEYNVSARSYQASVSGISAEGSTMSGGNSRDVKVVSAEDVDRAYGDLVGRSTDEAKEELSSQFDNGEKTIESSFNIQRGDPSVSPTVGAEAPDGTATLTVPTTYVMVGVPEADLKSYLDEAIENQIVGENQRVYDNGFDGAELSNFRVSGDTLTATLTATGQIGPDIDEDAIKEQVKGMRYGEVQSTLEAIDGVSEVDVQFSYFWVWTVPNNVEKIDIEFALNDE